MWSFPKSSMTPEVMGKTLFDIIIDDRMYSETLKVFASTVEPIFVAPVRDTGLYSVLMPEIDSCERNDLKILRIELMHFAFVYVDFLLMRSIELHERFGASQCFETLHWCVWEFKKRIDPLGKSADFIAANEVRMRAYNDAWDQMLKEGDNRNRILIEETLFRFCEPTTPITNVVLHLQLQRELSATGLMFMKFFETHKLHK
jgi:hypothetical protein